MGFLIYTCIVVQNTIVIIIGPTGVGKTSLSLRLAEKLNCSIISSDSRQIFRELKIGTAAPEEEQLARVKHYFIANKSINDYYSAGQYEQDALHLLDALFVENPVQIVVGGSMLYVDALCDGLDEIPRIDDELRQEVLSLYQNSGLQGLQERLEKLDPVYSQLVDRNNKQRIIHAIEVSMTIGKPYSELLQNKKKKRPFKIIKIGLTLPREQLYQQINLRVDQMMQKGLLDEARAMYPYRHLNSLKTVGYREIFEYMDGEISIEEAVEKIKRNSRRYAKRQLTWFNADEEIHWFSPFQYNEIDTLLKEEIGI